MQLSDCAPATHNKHCWNGTGIRLSHGNGIEEESLQS
jgi:hypothetical protein